MNRATQGSLSLSSQFHFALPGGVVVLWAQSQADVFKEMDFLEVLQSIEVGKVENTWPLYLKFMGLSFNYSCIITYYRCIIYTYITCSL